MITVAHERDKHAAQIVFAIDALVSAARRGNKRQKQGQADQQQASGDQHIGAPPPGHGHSLMERRRLRHALEEAATAFRYQTQRAQPQVRGKLNLFFIRFQRFDGLPQQFELLLRFRSAAQITIDLPFGVRVQRLQQVTDQMLVHYPSQASRKVGEAAQAS